MTAGSIVVIGIGNPDRGDDGAGPAVAARLEGSVPGGVAVLAHDGEAASLLDRMAGATTAILVDACVSGAAPGTVRRIDVHAEALPAVQFGLSTHGFGLGEAIALGRALGGLPQACVVYAVEAASFEAGAPLTPAVAEAADRVADAIRSEVMAHA